MTKAEFRPLLWFLANGCRTEFDRGQCAAWFAGLSDLPTEVVTVGIARFVCEVGQWPDIATVRRFANEARHGLSKSWTKALEETRQAIRRHGLYGQKEALAMFDERTRQTVNSLGGWQKLCDWPIDQSGILTAQFRDIYQDISRRADSHLALPPDIRPKLVSSINGADRLLSHKAGRWLSRLTNSFSRLANRGEKTDDETLIVSDSITAESAEAIRQRVEPGSASHLRDQPPSPAETQSPYLGTATEFSNS